MNTIMNTTQLYKWTVMLALVLGLAVTSTSSAFMEDAVGHWLLDDNEADSNVLDDSCGGHDGTFYDENGPNNTEGHHIGGKLGGALHFDAYDEDHILVPSHSDFEFDEYDAFSIAFWIKSAESQYPYRTVVSKMNYQWQGYDIHLTSYGIAYFRVSEDEHQYFIMGYGTTDVADSNWHFVACTYDGSGDANGILVYVDGSEDDTSVFGDLWEGSAANSEPLCFAAQYNETYGSGDYFGGDLDDVSIYSEELSASEVNDLWNDSNGLSYPSCWNCLTQCHADADCNGEVNIDDWPPYRDGFMSSYPDPVYLANVCGDNTRDGHINIADWPELRDNLGKSVPADCNCGGVWPPN